MKNLMGQMPVPPFAESPKTERPEDRAREMVKRAEIRASEDDQRIFLDFAFPPEADWRSVVVYQKSLARQTGDELVRSEPFLQPMADRRYRFSCSKRWDEATLEDAERWRRDIEQDAVSDDNLEEIDREFTLVEKRLAEDKSYADRKKRFLEDLIRSLGLKTDFADDLPITVEVDYDGVSFRVMDGDLIDQTIDNALRPKSFDLDVDQDHLSRLFPEMFELKTISIKIARRSDESYEDFRRRRDKLVEYLKATLLDAFRNLLKSGPGRNKIKYELKKMSPDYRPREAK